MKFHQKTYGVVPYKVVNDRVKILLCKSVASKDKWGCLKGSKNRDETAFECAKRELFEESGINADILLFEEYFEQLNIDKDVGAWLVNANNLDGIDKMFTDDVLKEKYLSWENSKVKYFYIDNLPKIKSKQIELIKNIKDFLKSKTLHH